MAKHWLIGAMVSAAGLAAWGCAVGPETAPIASTSTCAIARPFAFGLSSETITSNGRPRAYEIYVPQTYDGRSAAPVVFDLHASGISPRVELAITGMDRAAEERGFIVVAPAAVAPFPDGGTTWNVPYRGDGVDDVAFVTDVLEHVQNSLCIDESRIYAIGFSGGARLASELACRAPSRFTAISAVGGLQAPASCELGSTSILAFHSLDDPINHYEHDPARSPPWWTHGVDDALARWSETLACASPRVETQLAADIDRVALTECRGGAHVVLYRMSGSGHTWPGSAFEFPQYLGETEHDLNATELSVQFFMGPPAEG